jgi:DNA (cytosine-5)-methyltransferase 1
MSPKKTKSRLVAIDAFCGAGGLSLGLKRAGFLVGAAFDNNEYAVATYRQNLGEHVLHADIRDMTVKKLVDVAGVDPSCFALIAGGAPCQGFSVQRRNGTDDPRNSLPLAFLKLVLRCKPSFFLFENVPGIRNRHGETILRTLVKDAEASGYICHNRVLDAVNYGVPQRRKRLFIVGELSEDGKIYFRFPKPITEESSKETRVRSALAGLASPPEDFSPHPTIPNHRRTRLSALNLKRLSLVPQGGGMEDLPVDLRVNCHRNGPDRIGHRFVYGRLHWDEPASTITARFDSFTRGKFAHPLEDRNITLHEGALLQSFPKDFIFVGPQEEIAAQIGNAVSPKLAQALGTCIRQAIERRRSGKEPLLCSTNLMQARPFD